MIWFFVFPIFILCFTAIAFYSVITQRLLNLGIQSPRYELRRSQDLPTPLAPLFHQPLQGLKQQGFQLTAALQVQPLIYTGPEPDWELLLFHPHWNTYAHISLHYPLEPSSWYRVAFYSFFRDRSLLLTLNGSAHSLIGQLPKTIIQDFYTADLGKQWLGHQQTLKNQPEAAVKIPRPLYANALEAHYLDYVQSLWDQELLLPTRPQPDQPCLQRLSWPAALQTAGQICCAQTKALGLTRQYGAIAQANSSHRIELSLELDVENFERMQQLELGALRRRRSGWLFWVSLVVCLLSFWTYLDREIVLLLLAAIALHEGGHYLAMSWLGYRDTSVFFLPFLGAAATGSKADASLGEQILVLLAGPLPGVCLGLLCLAGSGFIHGFSHSLSNSLSQSGSIAWLMSLAPWLETSATILLGLNLFNLLPLYPLDGGRIAHLLLFSLSPWSDVGFKLVAIAALSLLGFLNPILWLLPLAVALTLPHSFRSAKLQAHLRRSSKPKSSRRCNPESAPSTAANQRRDSSIQQIFSLLWQFGYGQLPFAQRYLMAKDLWERRQEPAPRWTTRCILAALYLICLLGLPLGTAQLYRSSNHPGPSNYHASHFPSHFLSLGYVSHSPSNSRSMTRLGFNLPGTQQQ